jgi:type I restriction enzyme, S subunit
MVKTESVKIPKDWKLVQIGDHFNFKNGLNKAKEFFGQGTPIINYMDVYPYPAIKSKNIHGKVTVTNDEQRSFEVRKGDVIFTRTSETIEEIGLSSVVIDDVKKTVFSGFLLRARPKTELFELQFKKYCFRSKNVRNQVISTSSQTTRALTNGKLLSKVFVLIPINHKEQKKIAESISDIEILINKLEIILKKKKNIKRGTMQELLTGKRRLEGFSEEWKSELLGDILDYEQPTKYLVKSTEYDDKYGIPVLTAGKTFILGYTAEESESFQNTPVIIFDDFTTSTKYVDFSFKAKSSAMKILKAKHSRMNLKFIYERIQLINFPLGEHKRRWISEFSNLLIKVPKYEEQNSISQILSNMDSEIQELKTNRDKYIMMKSGMMQKLLTGEIKLT